MKDLSNAVVDDKKTIARNATVRKRNNSMYTNTSKEEAQDEEAVVKMEAMLIHLFTEADQHKTGYLTAIDFKQIISGLNLGIDAFQQSILLAEADENEDAKIQYGEFVPICAELLQTYKAKVIAETTHFEQELKLDKETQTYLLSHEKEIAIKVSAVVDNFKAADHNNTDTLKRTTIHKCLHSNKLLTKAESNLVLHALTMDSDGNTNYMVSNQIGIEEVSEQSEQALMKTSILAMKCANWQTQWLSPLLLLANPLNSFDSPSFVSLSSFIQKHADCEVGLRNDHSQKVRVRAEALEPIRAPSPAVRRQGEGNPKAGGKRKRRQITVVIVERRDRRRCRPQSRQSPIFQLGRGGFGQLVRCWILAQGRYPQVSERTSGNWLQPPTSHYQANPPNSIRLTRSFPLGAAFSSLRITSNSPRCNFLLS